MQLPVPAAQQAVAPVNVAVARPVDERPHLPLRERATYQPYVPQTQSARLAVAHEDGQQHTAG